MRIFELDNLHCNVTMHQRVQLGLKSVHCIMVEIELKSQCLNIPNDNQRPGQSTSSQTQTTNRCSICMSVHGTQGKPRNKAMSTCYLIVMSVYVYVLFVNVTSRNARMCILQSFKLGRLKVVLKCIPDLY